MATAKRSPINFLSVSSIMTILFCFAIAVNVTPLLRGPAPYPPEWQWVYEFDNTIQRIWAPLIVIGGFVGSFFLFERVKQNKKYFTARFLAHIIFLTLFLQLSVLYFSRAGVGVLLERIITPGISGYFTTALSIQNIGNFLSTYQEHVATFTMRAADHPPFAILFFWVLLSLSHALSFLFPFVEKLSLHHTAIFQIWHSLLPFQKVAALLSTLLIPVLSVSILIPLYFFAKVYYDEVTARRACFLYSVFPSVSLFLPLNDAFLGLFSVVGFLCFLLGQKWKKGIFYYLSGISFAIGSFFSISLLVPLGMVCLFGFLSTNSLREKVTGGIRLLVGVVTIPAVLFIFFHFNTISVFAKIASLQAKRSYLTWVVYDIYDFFVFSGIPVLIGSIILIKEMLVRKASTNMLAISFFIVLFLLDIFGFSRAEVGRIWMPYMPFLAVIVAGFLTKIKKASTATFATILFLQIVQLLVMQEFWVTLW